MKIHEVVIDKDGSWSCSTCGAGGISKRTADSHGEISESVRVQPKHVIRESATIKESKAEANLRKNKTTARLVEAYKLMGLTPQEALVAAGVEQQITEGK